MTNPARAVLQRLVDAFRIPGQSLPIEEWVAMAEEALATPTPPADPDALAARPLLEAVAQMGDCIGQHTVGQIMALSNRAASWLNENPPGQPVAIEPRGCPTPGACSCVQPVAPTPPADGEVEELIWRLGWIVAQLSDIGWEDDSASVDRAAALLRQLPPEGLEAMEYFHTDSGARVVHEPRDGEPGWCWTVRNHRRVNPCTEFPTLAAAWEALQQARREEVGE